MRSPTTLSLIGTRLVLDILKARHSRYNPFLITGSHWARPHTAPWRRKPPGHWRVGYRSGPFRLRRPQAHRNTEKHHSRCVYQTRDDESPCPTPRRTGGSRLNSVSTLGSGLPNRPHPTWRSADISQ